MNEKETVCLLNDSFPPLIDGVANTVLNYAKHLEEFGTKAVVVTPAHPQADDSRFSYPVIRYPSVNFSKMDGYMAGVPFSPQVAGKLADEKVALIHSHCPIISNFMAREIRQIKDAPIVLTYHTKFDIDIENVVKNQRLQNACKKALLSNINACDEVWAVSEGAGQNLKSLGFEGDYIVMPNGVDLPHERISDDKIAFATHGYDLPKDIPVYLFVGRMMWYKGIQLIMDALSLLKQQGKSFRAVFIGEGDDRLEIQNYATLCGIKENCIFTGAIRNRERLRAWYCRADLFLFPSTYDTNGLVVREAAASDLATVLIKDSCAAEGVTDGRNGFLIEENAEALCKCLASLYDNKDIMQKVGKAAGEEIYISWRDAVQKALKRYEYIVEKHKRGEYPKHYKPMEGVMKINGELMETLARISKFKRNLSL